MRLSVAHRLRYQWPTGYGISGPQASVQSLGTAHLQRWTHDCCTDYPAAKVLPYNNVTASCTTSYGGQSSEPRYQHEIQCWWSGVVVSALALIN